jgi:ferric-dicitrate binding protein FerR (iron transport regulator)
MLNRYLEKKVVIGDAVANNIKISGTFSSRQNKETLVAVAQALQLEIKSDTDKWVLFQSIP